jgi:hypothetical protein
MAIPYGQCWNEDPNGPSFGVVNDTKGGKIENNGQSQEMV